jgi:hypothetical protein
MSRKDIFSQRDDKSHEGDPLRTSGFEWNTVLNLFSYRSYKKKKNEERITFLGAERREI